MWAKTYVDLWRGPIADFEKREAESPAWKNVPAHIWEARMSARMAAYVALAEKVADQNG